MTNKIVRYKVIEDNKKYALEHEVELWIKQGYQPFGGVSVCVAARDSSPDIYTYTQAIVKYEGGE